MKKRYLAIPAVIYLLAVSIFQGLLRPIAPVRPFIQLPGETYPLAGSKEWFNGMGWTNTFSSTIVAWVIVLLIAYFVRGRSRTADEVPTGFYNFFEMIFEGAYNFVENLTGRDKARDFFPWFMTYLMIILAANWFGLFPGVDSIGFQEFKPHFEAEKEAKAVNNQIAGFAARGETEEINALLADLTAEYDLPHTLEVVTKDGETKLTDESKEELIHGVEVVVDAENKGDLLVGAGGAEAVGYKGRGWWLQRAETVDGKATSENADWTIVPFFRPAATDLNFTLAFALVAMFMVQYYGIKYLGFREYFAKFFPFIGAGFGKSVADNPINGINVAVGLLEFIGEFSKVLSFGFRLLGNIFAGMVLLFVMALLLPAANIIFFGLELFVGLIQALVFALLMIIFMNGATESHHGDHHDDDHH